MKRLIIVLVVMWASILAPTFGQWNQVYSLTGGFYGFCFTDSLNGWFTHQGTEKILHTSDGGYTFDVQSVTPGQYTLWALYMEDELNGWVAGQGISGGPGIIHHTTNGGNTWVQMTHPAPSSGWAAIAKVGNSVWFCGLYGWPSNLGIIMKTSDNGQSWQLTQYPQFGGIGSIHVFDSLNVVIAGAGGLLSRTTDGGTSWISTILPSDYYVEKVVFSNQNIGYALVTDFDPSPTDAYIYQSTDGGFTWNLHYSWVDQGQKPGLSVIPASSTVFVCGMLHATTPYSYGILKSSDAGLTWNTVMQSSTNSPMKILTPDIYHGWGAGGANIYRYDYLTPVVVEPISNKLIQFGELFTYQVQATGLGLRYSLYNQPSGLNINYHTGLINGTPTQSGVFNVNVAVRDTDINVVNTNFELTIVVLNSPPYFITVLPDTSYIEAEHIYNQLIEASDVNDDTLSFIARRLPHFLTLKQGDSTSINTAEVKGTPAISDTGYYDIQIVVVDGKGGTDTISWVLNVGYLVSVSETNDIPNEYALQQNYPNPFNPATRIKFQLPQREFVTLKIFDVLGNEVKVLVSEEMQMGNYEIEFNASNIPSGVYFYRIQAGDYTAVKKMILLK